jgi:hypothetical protein
VFFTGFHELTNQNKLLTSLLLKKQFLWEHELQVKYKKLELKSGEFEDNWRALSMSQLEYGFVLWLIAVCISTAVFLVEFLGSRVKILVTGTVGLIRFLKLLRKVIRTNRLN